MSRFEGSFTKFSSMSIMKAMSTTISNLCSVRATSEKTRLKKSVRNWKMDLRERSGKESIDRKEVDYETPKLNAFSVGPDDVPSI